MYIPRETILTGKKSIINEFMTENDVLLIPSSDNEIENRDPYETLEYNQETDEGIFKLRLLQPVSEVKGGDFFGELSLIMNKPRAATVLTQIPTHAASLSRPDYEKIIKPIEERKLNSKINYLKSFPFLSHLSRQTLSKLPHSAPELTFNRGNTVYHESDKADGFYLVYQGEFKIFKRLEIKPSQTFQRFGKYGKKVVKKDDICLVSCMPGQYFGAIESVKKPFVREYTVR